MRVRLADDGWYIEGVPPYEADGRICDRYGPYATRREAQEDLRGVKRTLASMPDSVSEKPGIADAADTEIPGPMISGPIVQKKLFA